jgi:hypothetical protein
MKTHKNLLKMFLLSLLLCGYECQPENLDLKYQPLGTVVLTANNLLMVQYHQGLPDNYSGEDYKNILKEKNQLMYQRLQPYRVTVQKLADKFKVSVFDGNTLVLTDWSCTEGKIDCWSYKNECLPDTMHVPCDQ